MDNSNKVDFSGITKKEIIDLFKSVYKETIPSFLMSPNAKYIQKLINRLSFITEEQLLQQFYPIMGNDDLFRLFLEEENYTRLLPEIDILNIQKKHKNNYTLLMAVVANPKICKFDKKIVIDVLLDKGEDIDATNDLGESALILALRKNDTYLVEYLLEKGANINSLPDNYGILATHITVFNKWQYLTSLLNYYNGSTVCPIPIVNLDCQDLARIVDSNAMILLLDEIENKYVTHKEMMEL
ncbi:MAG: hypothetical protein E7020_05195 [Alphaproteobacteria bacterium]|nr:hypothetical protein [Alphaproteobacteria bacterium]